MKRQQWIKRMNRVLFTVMTGACLFGSSCAMDVRDSIVSGALDAVTGESETFVAALIPVEQLLAAFGLGG
jgi:hypothetical protein